MFSKNYTLPKSVLILFLVVFFVLMLGLSFGVDAQSAADRARQGVDITCEGFDCGDAETGFRNIVTSIIGILSLIVGAASVVMIVIGGLRYTTSSGNPQAVSSAKNTILYAIIGLLIAIFAQYIVQFVVGTVADGSTSANTAPTGEETGVEVTCDLGTYSWTTSPGPSNASDVYVSTTFYQRLESGTDSGVRVERVGSRDVTRASTVETTRANHSHQYRRADGTFYDQLGAGRTYGPCPIQ